MQLLHKKQQKAEGQQRPEKFFLKGKKTRKEQEQYTVLQIHWLYTKKSLNDHVRRCHIPTAF